MHRSALTKRMIERRKLFKYEGILYTSSTIFTLTSFVLVLVLFFRFQARSFGQFNAAEVYLLIFTAGILAFNSLHHLIASILRHKKRFLETDLQHEGVHPIYDQDSFQDILKNEMQRSARYRFPLSLCFIRLDDNSLAQTPQTQTRSQLVKRFANLVASMVRASDHVALWDDETFSVLLCHTPMTSGEQFLLRALLQTQERFEMSFSAGITAYRAGEKPVELIQRSQHALNQARLKGTRKIHCAISRENLEFIRTY